MMKPMRKALLDRLPAKATSPALRQIQQLAEDRSTEVDAGAPVQAASEVLSIWSIRLWNATLRGRRFVGLADLVRALMALAPGASVEQVSLRNGPKLGLIFFDAKTFQPIGAVVSVRLEADERRSRETLSKASGVYFPVVAAASLVRESARK